MRTVVENVVEKGWCVGCGMCAAVCPKRRLGIRWNERGEHNPVTVENAGKCGQTCDVCFSVCPAHGRTKNETEIGRELYGDVEGIQYRAETGYYLASYIGYSNVSGHRPNGASGGMATWTLETLLTSGEVDAVIAVGRTTNPDRFFEFRICTTPEDVRQCSRSAYYPVETSQVIRHVLENDGRYAIIGLPCVCKAIRLAQDHFPKLKQRIRYVLGLTCGHTCSRYFAEYLAALGGADPHDLREVIFRIKNDPAQPISNLAMYFRSGQDQTAKTGTIRWDDGFGFAFVNGYFQVPGCFFCDDVFAECADATFMDAWLPEYAQQPEGMSIALVRSPEIARRFALAPSESARLDPISIEGVVDSQKGAHYLKRSRRYTCLRQLAKAGKDVPARRDHQLSPVRNPALYRRDCLVWKAAHLTSRKWIEVGKDVAGFNRQMRLVHQAIRVLGSLSSMRRLLHATKVLPSRLMSVGKRK